MIRCFTLPSAFVTISLRGAFMCTAPPLDSMYSCMGAQTRSGWFPSKNAIWRPLSSFKNRFMAVSTTWKHVVEAIEVVSIIK